MSQTENYRKWVLSRVNWGSAVRVKRKKDDPKPPRGDSPRRPSLTTKALVGLTPQKLFDRGEVDLHKELGQTRDDGLIVCCDGIWSARKGGQL